MALSMTVSSTIISTEANLSCHHSCSGPTTYFKIVKEQFSEFTNYFVVKDTYKALVDIAKYKRKLFEKPIIGITGSVGKTTLKEMIAFVFSQNYKVGMTLKNFNNHIGLPLCLANLQNDCNLGVFEMGMSSKGEIKFLGEVLKFS